MRPVNAWMRHASPALIAVLAAFGSHPALAEYPDRPVKVLIGFSAGGPKDAVARAIFAKVADDLKQPFLIENRPGANSNIATLAVSRAEADGYTLLYATSSTAINVPVYKTVDYEVRSKLAPVMMAASVPQFLLVPASLKVASADELLAQIRQQPGKWSFGSAGMGNGNHLAMQLVLDRLGLNATHVPYKGSAPAMVDLAAGRVQMMLDTVNTTWPLVKDGRLRALAVSSTARIGLAPEVPTIAESLLPGFEAGAWQGVWAPIRTPRLVIDRINQAMKKALADPGLRERLQSQGVVIEASSPEAFASYYDAELKRWTEVVDRLGIKPE